MQPQRETMTDSLDDIIQVIRSGNRSGTLTVERGEGEQREEGTVQFINGVVLDARVGQLRGLPALNYLCAWGRCFFAFKCLWNKDPDATKPAVVSDGAYKESHGAVNTSARPVFSSGEGVLDGHISIHRSGPVRLWAGEIAILHAGELNLSRVHRRLLLLIDGKRTKRELASLIARNLNEVQRLLDDLERANLIQQ